MEKLTEKQQAILDFIAEFQDAKGMAPTMYEIADQFEVMPCTIFVHIRTLQRKGKISKSSRARSIKITGRQDRHMKVVNIPLEDSTGEIGKIVFDRNIIGNEKYSAFKVPDNAMSEFGIFHEDVIIIELNKKPKSGDLVLAEVNGTSMLRGFYPSGVIAGNIELRPANPVFQSQRFHPSDIKIRGVVVALQRKY